LLNLLVWRKAEGDLWVSGNDPACLAARHDHGSERRRLRALRGAGGPG